MNTYDHLDRHIRILLIDDLPELRVSLFQALSGLGFTQVIPLGGAVEALAWFEAENQCDLIICDLNMPHMSGLEFLARIRKDTRFKTVPFLMITAMSTKDNVVAAARAGVTDFVVKPFSIEHLLDKMSALRGLTRMAALRNLYTPGG